MTKELACYVSYLPLQIVSFQIPQAGGIYFHRLLWSKIGIPAKDEKNPTSLGVTIAYPVWAPISLLMPFFSSVINVSHRRILQVKKCLKQKMFRPPRYACNYADKSRKLQKADWVVPKLTNWRRAYWETTSGIVQNLKNLSYRGCANLKISIFLLNMFVCMLIELENHKILQAGCFWSWQIKEEGKLSSIDISGQLLW